MVPGVHESIETLRISLNNATVFAVVAPMTEKTRSRVRAKPVN